MIRFGVVGLGAIGMEHVGVLAHMPGAVLAAVADRDTQLARSRAAETHAAAFGSARELVESGTVDAVVLSTPDNLHFDDAKMIIQSGTHLLLEKPIATDVAQADELARLAAHSTSVTMPGHTLRFDERYLRVHDAVTVGAIGDVVHGYARRDNKLSVGTRVGGRTSVAFFLGIHDIDALQWVTGLRVTGVTAQATGKTLDRGGQPVAILSTLRMDNGSVIQLESAWGLPDDYPTEIDARLRLVGSVGEIAIDIHDHGIHEFSGTTAYPFPVGSVYGLPTGMLANELGAFARAIASGLPAPVTMTDAADAVRVAAAVDEAVSTGQPVAVSRA